MCFVFLLFPCVVIVCCFFAACISCLCFCLCVIVGFVVVLFFVVGCLRSFCVCLLLFVLCSFKACLLRCVLFVL